MLASGVTNDVNISYDPKIQNTSCQALGRHPSGTPPHILHDMQRESRHNALLLKHIPDGFWGHYKHKDWLQGPCSSQQVKGKSPQPSTTSVQSLPRNEDRLAYDFYTSLLRV
jgi:hypothetical protein